MNSTLALGFLAFAMFSTPVLVCKDPLKVLIQKNYADNGKMNEKYNKLSLKIQNENSNPCEKNVDSIKELNDRPPAKVLSSVLSGPFHFTEGYIPDVTIPAVLMCVPYNKNNKRIQYAGKEFVFYMILIPVMDESSSDYAFKRVIKEEAHTFTIEEIYTTKLLLETYTITDKINEVKKWYASLLNGNFVKEECSFTKRNSKKEGSGSWRITSGKGHKGPFKLVLYDGWTVDLPGVLECTVFYPGTNSEIQEYFIREKEIGGFYTRIIYTGEKENGEVIFNVA